MAFEVVGREEELASVAAFVDEARDGPVALVIEGEAGIGKSTLWLAGVEHAGTQGLGVLSARPAEAERSLAYVGLGDLFEDVLDDVLPALTPPRRRALEIAMLRDEESGDRLDDRALAVAVRDVLEILCERGTPHVYTANTPNNAFIDPGGGHVHVIRDESGAVAKDIAVQLIPAGATRREDAPDPGNCHF